MHGQQLLISRMLRAPHFRLTSAARVCVLCLCEQRVDVRVEKENHKAVGCVAEDHVLVGGGMASPLLELQSGPVPDETSLLAANDCDLTSWSHASPPARLPSTSSPSINTIRPFRRIDSST
jgi:hypothetical protein